MRLIAIMVLVFTACMAAKVKAQDRHPGYLHALSDLRAARWMINHRPGDWKTTADEEAAVKKIDAAIFEIRRASIDDGKNIEDHPMADEINDHRGRLVKAVEWLRTARADIAKYEDNFFAKGLRRRAYAHIDEAIRLTEKARAGI